MAARATAIPLALPRTAAAVATELHELLRAQGIVGPYVLAAHSLGGAYAHRFAQLHPQDVAGLAATERMAPDAEQIGRMRPALREMRAELLATYPKDLRQPLLDAKGSDAWIRVGVAERSGPADLAIELRAGPTSPRSLSRIFDEASPAWQRILSALAHRAERRRTAGHGG
ncbi:hypothetical protein ABT382_35325 [Streptomyces pharetrae]|uniref:alpha/beta fold hydrolase n=1 Tax=Streptomyces pharetrae TaxID=291370 RepID=UPI0033512B68